MKLSAAVVVIGNEILSGRVVDTNSSLIAQELRRLGAEVRRVYAVRDEFEEIIGALQSAAASAPLIITSGGVGPTTDDLTREAIARFLGVSLVKNGASEEKLHRVHQKRGMPMNPISIRQCMFPTGAEILENSVGTADCFHARFGKGQSIIALPGVPTELKTLLREKVIPSLPHYFSELGLPSSAHLHCFGLSESHLGSVVESVNLPHEVEVAYRPVTPEVWIELTSKTLPQSEVESLRLQVQEAIGTQFVFGWGENDTVQSVLGTLLQERGESIAAAESCTGGLLSDRIVSQPGASAYFLGTAVTYSNEAKENLLGVSPALLREHGAVSAEVALAMARGARERFHSTIGVATTGIAGPDGGSSEKPVGTVFIGVCDSKGEVAIRCSFPFERNRFRIYAAAAGLDAVRRRLLNIPAQWERR